MTDEKGFGIGCMQVEDEREREREREREKRIESRYSVKRVGIRGEETRRRKSFRSGEKPVRLKGRKVEKAEETNKVRKKQEGRKNCRGTAPYMVANEATDARSDNGWWESSSWKEPSRCLFTIPNDVEVEAARSCYLWRINIPAASWKKTCAHLRVSEWVANTPIQVILWTRLDQTRDFHVNN